MRSKQIQIGQEHDWVLIMETGDEFTATLQCFAEEQKLKASAFNAIGAFRSAVLGYFDWQRRDYTRIAIEEQTEVLTLTGDIALKDGKPQIHAHAVLGKSDGTACGGHVLEANVRPTLEVVIRELPATVERFYDPESGLHLIRF